MHSIRDEAAQEQAAAIAKRLEVHEYGTSLIDLFNVGLFDFVKQEKDGSYTPVDWPKDATHELIPTSWNNPRDFKPNKSGKRVMPDGFALSVCAVPMTRKFQLRGKMIKARKALPGPKERLAYIAAGPIEGKRATIRWMVDAMEAKVTKTEIREADDDKLNNIYRNLLMAHARLV